MSEEKNPYDNACGQIKICAVQMDMDPGLYEILISPIMIHTVSLPIKIGSCP